MCLTMVFNLLASSHLWCRISTYSLRWILLVEFMFLFLRIFLVWHIGLFHYLIICVNDMFYTIINLLNQFEFIDFLYFEASLIDNIHISLAPSSLLGGSQSLPILVLTNLFVSKPVLKKLGGRRGKNRIICNSILSFHYDFNNIYWKL